MKRLMMLVTLVLVMAATLVVAMAPTFAVTRGPDDGNLLTTGSRAGPAWGVPVTITACDTVAGVAGFEWRAGGDVCWLNLPVPLP
jgi:hypothetical protein